MEGGDVVYHLPMQPVRPTLCVFVPQATETCYLHSKSAANQIRFFRLREELASADGENRKRIAKEMAEIAEEEIRLAKRQFEVARKDSRIAYEATCHYFYRPLDLLEKILNCREVIRQLRIA